MKTPAILAVIFLVSFGALAEDQPEAEQDFELVKPYAYRIRAEYDEKTYDMIREAIRRDIRLALDDMQRRRALSEQLLKAQIEEELERLNREIEAIRHTRRKELEAIEREDIAEAERWRQLRLEHLRKALDLNERLRRLEELLVERSLADWREKRRRQREAAERALERLRQIEAEDASAPPPVQ